MNESARRETLRSEAGDALEGILYMSAPAWIGAQLAVGSISAPEASASRPGSPPKP